MAVSIPLMMLSLAVVLVSVTQASMDFEEKVLPTNFTRQDKSKCFDLGLEALNETECQEVTQKSVGYVYQGANYYGGPGGCVVDEHNEVYFNRNKGSSDCGSSKDCICQAKRPEIPKVLPTNITKHHESRCQDMEGLEQLNETECREVAQNSEGYRWKYASYLGSAGGCVVNVAEDARYYDVYFNRNIRTSTTCGSVMRKDPYDCLCKPEVPFIPKIIAGNYTIHNASVASVCREIVGKDRLTEEECREVAEGSQGYLWKGASLYGFAGACVVDEWGEVYYNRNKGNKDLCGNEGKDCICKPKGPPIPRVLPVDIAHQSSGLCVENDRALLTEAECREAAEASQGYFWDYSSQWGSQKPPGCFVDVEQDWEVRFNRHTTVTTPCGDSGNDCLCKRNISEIPQANNDEVNLPVEIKDPDQPVEIKDPVEHKADEHNKCKKIYYVKKAVAAKWKARTCGK